MVVTLMKKFYSNTFLTVMLTGTTLFLVGCSKQFQTLENNQAEIKNTLHNSSRQTMDKIAALEQTQDKLEKAVNQNRRILAAELSEVKAGHLRLQKEMKDTLTRVKGDIATVEQGQQQLNSGFAKNIRRLSANAETLGAIRNNMNELQNMVAKMNQHTMEVTSQAAGIADGQEKLTLMQRGISGNLERLITSIAQLQKNLISLKKRTADVDENTEKVNSKIAAVRKKQQSLDEEIGSNIRQVVRNIEAIERLNETVFPDGSTTKTASAKASVNQPKNKSED